jgi:hypothetical protein
MRGEKRRFIQTPVDVIVFSCDTNLIAASTTHTSTQMLFRSCRMPTRPGAVASARPSGGAAFVVLYNRAVRDWDRYPPCIRPGARRKP